MVEAGGTPPYTGNVDYREVAVSLMRLLPFVAETDRDAVRRAAGLAYAQYLSTDPTALADETDTLGRIESGAGFPDARPGEEVLAELYAHLAERRRTERRAAG